MNLGGSTISGFDITCDSSQQPSRSPTRTPYQLKLQQIQHHNQVQHLLNLYQDIVFQEEVVKILLLMDIMHQQEEELIIFIHIQKQ